jgi:hypothetical protein
MKARTSVAALFLAAASSLAFAATADEAVEEMKKCDVCKVMAADPELMQSMTWECHKIDAGMICVSTVPKENKGKYDAIQAKMEASVAQVKADHAAGKEVHLCSFCQGVGELEQAGAKEETVETQTGSVFLVTAADPAVVSKIHTHADQAIAQMKAMETAQR